MCVQPPKEPELNSLPKAHIATRDRTRKVEKGKCTGAVAIFTGEWMRGKDNPVHGDVNPVEPEFCHVLQSPQHKPCLAQLQPAQLARATRFRIQQHICAHSKRLGALQALHSLPMLSRWAATHTSPSHYPDSSL